VNPAATTSSAYVSMGLPSPSSRREYNPLV
jgi:hypothetical protein